MPRTVTPSSARRRPAPALLGAVVLPLAALLTLSGCVGGAAETPETPAASSTSTAVPTGTPAPVTSTLLPEGSAADNKPFFDEVNQALIAANPSAGGQEITSNLRDKGFDITAMQVTVDVTTVGVAADSVQFSVKWGDDCLIGQYGQGVYSSIVAPALGTGACLVGQTRTIDW